MMEAPNSPETSRAHTILIIDDEPANLEVIGNYLFEHNFQIMAVQTGEQGIALAKQEQPDLILLDVMLPGVDGFETCRRLKADTQTHEIPVIFMTIVTTVEEKIKGFSAGGVDYLTKPFQREEALARVTTHLRLRDLTLNLEQKIDERTKELLVANEKLQEEISERKRVEAALRLSEENLRVQAQQVRYIIDTVPEGVLLLSNAGEIVLMNPIAAQFLTLLSPDFENGRLSRIGNYTLNELLTSPPAGLWHEVTAADKYFEAIARPVENGTQNKGWVMVLRDVTQERAIQQHTQEQDRLAAIGQLAAGIAHDFNNILTVISLYTQLVMKATTTMPNPQQQLQVIDEQASRASQLIQQILDFSRQTLLDRQPVNLVVLLEESILLLERTLSENIKISLAHDPTDEFIIHADLARIQQVFINLALNARDAMPQGGQLQFNVTKLNMTAQRQLSIMDITHGEWIQVEVIDNGEGIAAENLSHIFEPFFTTKETGKGIGLGLAQLYGIVQQHGGTVDVQSDLGSGTTFTLLFPSSIAADAQEQSISPAHLPLGQQQLILVVEDNEATRQVLVDTLETLNYRTVQAENGRFALTILTKPNHGIDLILSDAVMPEMGGSALLHAVHDQNLNIPFIIVTGHPLEQDIMRLKGVRANSLVS